MQLYKNQDKKNRIMNNMHQRFQSYCKIENTEYPDSPKEHVGRKIIKKEESIIQASEEVVEQTHSEYYIMVN